MRIAGREFQHGCTPLMALRQRIVAIAHIHRDVHTINDVADPHPLQWGAGTELIERVMLVVVGLLFTAAIHPAAQILWYRDQPKYETAMGLAVYATLGIMLLMAQRTPSAHRSLIAFAAWSSFAHASVWQRW